MFRDVGRPAPKSCSVSYNQRDALVVLHLVRSLRKTEHIGKHRRVQGQHRLVALEKVCLLVGGDSGKHEVAIAQPDIRTADWGGCGSRR